MSSYINKYQQRRRNSALLLHWTPDTAFQKRKRQDGDEQDLRPSKRNQESLESDRSTELSSRESLNRKATGKMNITSSPLSSEISFVSIAADDTLQDLPELTHNDPKLPPEVDEWYSIDDMGPRDTF